MIRKAPFNDAEGPFEKIDFYKIGVN